ncbi:hypothetical protein SPRG_03325 [Saprolegnia parasitica CBS 223.65]|uniref:U-box domain-containing protein n=1 Tax=Saprolegnia parasitica (strain CBS 223.65) TaxID=695850 RepID=A0A067CZ84_SAPPC|nr:hypothetical protein SPRG_03325 [Saprolegnia parasitica CBS 223.65]KDO32107.1 hypothetical protein SPRG_03325 [Saprolegnia parasitica CBS 223.65]|eukprot:XP_012197292.1 hypothetical protein SPRG_03325 [Saprolegnia parasitica CBS 223.65]
MLASFICPISHEVMADPVVAMDGHSYERRCIATWLLTHLTSPSTNAPLASTLLLPNFALKQAIDEYTASHAAPRAREALPQDGYYIYRLLEPIHVCASPQFAHRAKRPDGSPYILPTGALVIATRRQYGQDDAIFLQIEAGRFIYEARSGIAMAARVTPVPGLRVHDVLAATPLYDGLGPTASRVGSLAYGDLVSTDLHVHDLLGGSFARLEGSMQWVSTAELLRVFPTHDCNAVALDDATTLVSNPSPSVGTRLETLQKGHVICSTMVFSANVPDVYVVRASSGDRAGWLTASKAQLSTLEHVAVPRLSLNVVVARRRSREAYEGDEDTAGAMPHALKRQCV